MHDMTGRSPETAGGVRFVDLDLRHAGLDGTFEGYASLFDKTDLGGDTVLAGAFRRSLAQRGAAGIRMLFQHDPAMPIGVWLKLHEDARGLYAKGRLAIEAAKAREVLALMRAGAVDGLSIGFRTVRADRPRPKGVRRIAEIDLWEISVVTFPMLPEARIARIKAAASAPAPLHAVAAPRHPDAGPAFHRMPRPGWERRVCAALGKAAQLLRDGAGTAPRTGFHNLPQ